MLPLLRSELFKLRHRRMTRAMLLLAAAGPFVGYMLLAALPASGPSGWSSLGLKHITGDGMFSVYQLGMIFAVIMAASSIATEFSWGTIRTLLPRTAGRSAFLGAKLTSLLLFVFLTVLLGFISALAASAVATELRHLDTSVGPDFLAHLLAAPFQTTLVILPYATLAFVVALWSRSTAAGIAVPIVLFYVEVLLTPLFDSTSGLHWLVKAGIYDNVTAVLGSHTLVPAGHLLGAWSAALVLLAYVVAFVAISFWRFRTRDIL